MELYTFVEAASEIGRSKTTMHRLVDEGKINCYQDGKGKPIYFSRHQLDAYLRSIEVKAKNPKKGGFSMKTLKCEETFSGSKYWVIYGFGWVYIPSWKDKETGERHFKKQRPDENGKRHDSWYIRYYVGKERKSDKAKGAKTFKEAVKILVETIENQRGKTNQISDDGLKEVTLGEFFEEREENISKDVAKAYRYSISRFISENSLLSAIDVDMIKNYIEWMKRRNNLPNVINKRLQCLRKLLDEADDLDYKLNMNKNPVRKTLFQNVEKKAESDTPIITPEQQEILFPLLETHVRITAMIARMTGMRKGEVISLEWTDFYLNGSAENSWIQLRATETKCKYERIIPLNVSSGLYELFVNLKKQINAIKDSEFTHKSDRQFVILSNTTGKWFHPKSIEKYWIRAMEKSGLKGTGIKFHSLRHTFITEKKKEKMDSGLLMKITGHKSLEMQGRYTHIKPEELCEMV